MLHSDSLYQFCRIAFGMTGQFPKNIGTNCEMKFWGIWWATLAKYLEEVDLKRTCRGLFCCHNNNLDLISEIMVKPEETGHTSKSLNRPIFPFRIGMFFPLLSVDLKFISKHYLPKEVHCISMNTKQLIHFSIWRGNAALVAVVFLDQKIETDVLLYYIGIFVVTSYHCFSAVVITATKMETIVCV